MDMIAEALFQYIMFASNHPVAFLTYVIIGIAAVLCWAIATD